MSVERIEAAIAKLEGLRSGCWPGAWDYHDGVISTERGFELFRHHENDVYTNGAPIDGEALAQARLVITLHRTVDAQLAILRLGVEFAAISPNRYTDAAAALADAILGES